MFLRPENHTAQPRALLRTLRSPLPCADPTKALLEIGKWSLAAQRCMELQVPLPPIELCYRGARSVFGAIFDNHPEVHTVLEWGQLERSHGYPDRLTAEGLRAILNWGEAKLTRAQTVHVAGQCSLWWITDVSAAFEDDWARPKGAIPELAALHTLSSVQWIERA